MRDGAAGGGFGIAIGMGSAETDGEFELGAWPTAICFADADRAAGLLTVVVRAGPFDGGVNVTVGIATELTIKELFGAAL